MHPKTIENEIGKKALYKRSVHISELSHWTNFAYPYSEEGRDRAIRDINQITAHPLDLHGNPILDMVTFIADRSPHGYPCTDICISASLQPLELSRSTHRRR